MKVNTLFNSWILTMVIENPIQFTMVRADPTRSCGAALATNVENCGESPDTTIPQKMIMAKNKSAGT